MSGITNDNVWRVTTNDNELQRVKYLTAISYSTCLHEIDSAFAAILPKPRILESLAGCRAMVIFVVFCKIGALEHNVY